MKYFLFRYCFLLVLCLILGMPRTVWSQVEAARMKEILQARDEAVLLPFLEKEVESEADLYYVSIACKKLAQVGTEKAIPTLEKLLPNERLNHYARYALEAIPSDTVLPVLRQAAQTLSGQLQADTIDSLGVRKDAGAVPMLKEILAETSDSRVKNAIYEALGQIADAASIALLREQIPRNASVEGLATGLLFAADTCLQTNRTTEAIGIYRELAQSAFPVPMQRAGRYRGWLAEKTAGSQSLCQALTSENPDFWEPALKVLGEYDSETIQALTPTLLEQLPTFPPSRQTLVLYTLGKRPEKAVLEAVYPHLMKRLPQENVPPEPTEEVLRILACLGNAGTVDWAGTLEKLLAYPSPQWDSALLPVCASMPGLDSLISAQLQAYLEHPRLSHDKIRFVMTVAEERQQGEMAETLLKIFQKYVDCQPVRDRAISAAASLIAPEQFATFVQCLDRLTIENQVMLLLQKACVHLPREKAAETIVALFDSEERLEQKRKWLGLLKLIGGNTALQCLEKASEKAATLDMATRILGTWSDPETMVPAAEICLKIARTSSEEKYHVRAIRGYIRIPRQFHLPMEEKIAMCQKAFETARREEDKLLIFEVLRRILDPASAEAAFSYAQHDFCRETACQTVVSIAREMKEKSPRIAVVLQKVAETTPTESLKKEARDLAIRLQ